MIGPDTEVGWLGIDLAAKSRDRAGYAMVIAGEVVAASPAPSPDHVVNIFIDGRDPAEVLREALRAVYIEGKTVILRSGLPSAAQLIALAADDFVKNARMQAVEDWFASYAAQGQIEGIGAGKEGKLTGLLGNEPAICIVDDVDYTEKREAKIQRKAARPRWRR